MKNKLTLVVPIIVTVFVITAGMGVITKVSANNIPQVNTSPTVDSTASESYQHNSTLVNDFQAQTSFDPSLEAIATYLLTADQASSIAQQIAGVAPKYVPELVSFNGTPAYEVEFINGDIYVDANSGVVLFNDLQKTDTEDTTELEENDLKTSRPVEMETSTNHDSELYDARFEDGQSVYKDLDGKVVDAQMESPEQHSNSSSISEHESESSNNDDDQDQ